MVVYTHRGDDIRLISARTAIKGERKSYEEGISEIRQLITGFIEEYKKSGEEIPIDNYSIASVRVPV